jgi:ATP-dependent helicase/nuclease subunit A
MTGADETGGAADRRLSRRPGGTPPLSADQRSVFEAHFSDDAVVAAAAGSGTGKTTTAVEVVAEAVVRELDRAPERNPFESILVTTFTRDAARQLKTELKERLREHRAAAPPDDPVVRRWDDLLRWLETASHVRTLDSFTQELLREIAPEVGVDPDFSVADGIRRSDLLAETFEAVTTDPDLTAAVDRLERAFPSEDTPDGPRGNWREMVTAIHRCCREFGTPIPEARRELVRAVGEMHAGREPESFADVLAVVDDLTDFDARMARDTVRNPERWAEYARETYRTSHRLAGDFGRVLAAFDREYDRRSRRRGVLTHTDITYVVREYLRGAADGDTETVGGDADRRERFRASLADRFRHVVVDEFQDTNYAQCRVLSHVVGDRTLLIGDLKQSVYEWRSAEPRLFAELLDYAAGDAEGNVLDADRVRRVDLAENFRSHPHLVRAANHLFPRIFEHPGRGDIGTFDVSYEPLEPRRPETDPESAHVHALDVTVPDDDGDDRSRRERVVEREAERVAGVLRTALDEGRLRVAREPAGDGDADTEPVRAGDVAILFRSRRYMRRYSQVLDRYGVENAVIGTRSLFREPEVQTLIDALAWLERPGDATRTRRVVESALSGVSAAGRAELAAHEFDVDRALAAWSGPAADRREVAALRELREDLRYVRDGSKADLVADLLTHSAFDVTALGGPAGLQRYANLRRFVEVVAGWEADDRLPYDEFVRRLEGLRSGRVEDDTAPAAVADMDSPDTVKLLTAHTAKGLEFPVVVLADTTKNEAYGQVCNQPFVADRRHGMALRPVAGFDEPPPGELPTFRGGWYHDGDAGFALDRGVLWLSEVRGSDGRLRHDHPLAAHVRDRRAEFWRLLYVAVTRASDHLVLPLAPVRGGEYTTWAAALAEHLAPGDPDGGAAAGVGVVETDDGPLPVGVDSIDAADPVATESTGLADLLEPVATGESESEGGTATDRSFRPAAVTAETVAAAQAPPALGRVLTGREDPLGLPPVDRTAAALAAARGTPVDGVGPDGVPGDRLATLLGQTAAELHRDGEVGAPGPAVTRALATVPVADDAREWLRAAVDAYGSTDLAATVAWTEECRAGVDLAAPLSALLGDGPDDLVVRGRVDLLYRDGDQWRAALFVPADGGEAVPDEDRRRVEQVSAETTARLLAARGTTVADVTVCRLPAGTCRSVVPAASAPAALRALSDPSDGE